MMNMMTTMTATVMMMMIDIPMVDERRVRDSSSPDELRLNDESRRSKFEFKSDQVTWKKRCLDLNHV